MIQLTNIVKRFGTHTAVDNLTLRIEKGEIFGLLGPNGAGKTTTVNMAIGLLKPDAGTVELAGLGSPEKPAVRAMIGVAPQALALYEDLTAEENLLFWGKIQKIPKKKLKRRVEESLEFVGLANRRKDRVQTYSGGMKRRLNLAVALIHEPSVILLDEPTAGVDPQSRNALFENIERLKKEGCTIVYTTHYMEEAQRLCDRVAIMDHGRLLALGTVNELIDTHGGRSVVVARSANEDIRIETDEPLAELLKLQQDTPLDRFSVEIPDLEGVFLNLTGRTLRD